MDSPVSLESSVGGLLDYTFATFFLPVLIHVLPLRGGGQDLTLCGVIYLTLYTIIALKGCVLELFRMPLHFVDYLGRC